MPGRKFFRVLVFATAFLWTFANAQNDRGWMLFHRMLQKMEDLTVQDRVDIIFALEDSMNDILPVDYNWRANEIDGLRSLITTGFSFGYSPEKIASACKTLYLAYQNGAVHPFELDFLELILTKSISASHLTSLTMVNQKASIFADEVRLALLNELSKKPYNIENIESLINFLKICKNENLNMKRCLAIGIACLAQIGSANELKNELNRVLNQMLENKEREEKQIRFKAIAGNFLNKGFSSQFLDAAVEFGVAQGLTREQFIYLMQTLEKGKNEQLSYSELFEKIKTQMSTYQINSQRDFEKVCDNSLDALKRKKISRETAQHETDDKYTSAGSEFISQLKEIVKEYLGTPYEWGGTTKYGIDCSGLTQCVFARLGIFLPRVSRQQYRVGKPVSKSNLKPGDLLFFSNNYFGTVDHVGIYLGNGKFCHASSTRGVTISDLSNHYYQVHFVGARRILLDV